MKKLLGSIALATTALAGTAHAADVSYMPQDAWFVHAGVTGVLFDSSLNSTTVPGNTGAYVTNNITGTLEAGRYIQGGFAVALSAGIPPTNELHALFPGPTDVQIGTATYGSIMALAQYHFNRSGQFSPYLGAGVAYNVTFSTTALAPATTVSIDNGFAPVLQAGVDFKVSDHFTVFGDVKKEFYSTTVHTNLGNANVKLDPWIVSAGIGFTF